ncbi:hypothetical protein PR202_gn00746 [Eleusine coracana subsp. coracana]|uniref:mevalonate kinase n=1 Tax=Eleusine coracana subsp. coracana TaxID=191504 RepID=A0AAV5G0I8_ELECO|nr:hypothetical protein PR202_gn00746 [Eleusine coracana subsp. coracana]
MTRTGIAELESSHVKRESLDVGLCASAFDKSSLASSKLVGSSGVAQGISIDKGASCSNGTRSSKERWPVIDSFEQLANLKGGEGGDADAVELDLKDLGLTFSWACSCLCDVLGVDYCKAEALRPCSADELAALAKLLEEHEIPKAKIWLSAGLSAFLFLYTSILGFKPGKVVVSSDLPMGAGLGSSAAFCVSMSGALLTAAGVVAVEGGSQGEEWEVFEKDNLELVNRWAFQGEKIIHGKPSGIDNAVSTFVTSISEELSSIVELAAEDEIAITSKEDKLAEIWR